LRSKRFGAGSSGRACPHPPSFLSSIGESRTSSILVFQCWIIRSGRAMTKIESPALLNTKTHVIRRLTGESRSSSHPAILHWITRSHPRRTSKPGDDKCERLDNYSTRRIFWVRTSSPTSRRTIYTPAETDWPAAFRPSQMTSDTRFSILDSL
jgi:hypothetical protein